MTSYKPLPYFEAPFSFKSKQILTRLAHDCSSHIYQDLHAEGEKWGEGEDAMRWHATILLLYKSAPLGLDVVI